MLPGHARAGGGQRSTGYPGTSRMLRWLIFHLVKCKLYAVEVQIKFPSPLEEAAWEGTGQGMGGQASLVHLQHGLINGLEQKTRSQPVPWFTHLKKEDNKAQLRHKGL